ncbi:putative O-linked N-acetylglucosamine transferase (SPINDLY family) [Stella humosa]|uniref:protein O-GlcNAc transferase n=1 Tax=Stella humosa TaxID=94 RepID=A0A3N1KHY9_9PROT|nr:hypothetical protein [Stella humosa]ROP81183.1 putative O-linked N-acetylglucosamine transferase (SPINDLY family) [Stella humosa]BBK32529.1 hypothetical protein STHU_31630 [Stella humosa]
MDAIAAPSPAPPSPAEAERRILAGDLAGAAALVRAAAGETAENPGWARLRLVLHLLDAGHAPGAYEGRVPDILQLVPAVDLPPPDLPALASAAIVDADHFARTVEAERRMALAAGRHAEQLFAAGDAQAAHDVLEQALAVVAPPVELFRLFGRVNTRLGRASDALFAHERAVDLAPDDRSARIELGQAMLAVEDHEGAAALLGSLALDPVADAVAYSCWLAALALGAGGAEALVQPTAEFRTAASRRMSAPTPRGPAPPRPRVGFLWSQGHRGAGYWMADLLRHRDRDRWGAVLYGVGLKKRFQASGLPPLFDRVVLCHDKGNAVTARQMAADGIDLLVSFAAHGHPGFLSVLDHRPARVHVEWLETGWPSGHPTVSHLLADREHCPQGLTDPLPCRVASFPGTMITGGPALETADRIGREREGGDELAFGWCGRAGAISEATLDAWAKIVQHVPGSTLRLRHDDYRLGAARERMTIGWLRRGMEPRRLLIDSLEEGESELAPWRAIDIALDSFPAGDIAATIDALAMGVPIITMDGARYAGRHAASAMRMLGMGRLVAPDPEQYIQHALRLAANRDLLLTMRAEIPDRMRASPLAGHPTLARAFEKAVDLLLGIARGA